MGRLGMGGGGGRYIPNTYHRGLGCTHSPHRKAERPSAYTQTLLNPPPTSGAKPLTPPSPFGSPVRSGDLAEAQADSAAGTSMDPGGTRRERRCEGWRGAPGGTVDVALRGLPEKVQPCSTGEGLTR